MSLLAILLIAVAAGTGPSFNAAAQAEYEILRAEPAISAGMHVVFKRIVARTVTELEWRVTVLSADYPRTVRISWVRPRTDGSLPASTVRLLTGSKEPTFGPVFGLGDPDETDWTAPWVSREVIRNCAQARWHNFRTGGWNLSGLFAGDLRWKRRYSTLWSQRQQDVLPAFVCGGGQFTVPTTSATPGLAPARGVHCSRTLQGGRPKRSSSRRTHSSGALSSAFRGP